VGDPVTGDRPSSKSTPFVLRLVTPDLVSVPTDSHSPGLAHYRIQHVLEGAETVAMQLADLAEELFTASASGDWTSITQAQMNLSPAYSITPSPAPTIEPPQPRVGTARMSATPTGRQSHSRSPDPIADQALVTQTVQPTVSVLADGLSVKAVASAWNNMTSRTQATQTVQPTVSVLADGLSVKAVASAWNNMTSRTQARAQSRGWTHTVAGASVSQQRLRFESAPARPQVIDRAARVRERIHRSQARTAFIE